MLSLNGKNTNYSYAKQLLYTYRELSHELISSNLPSWHTKDTIPVNNPFISLILIEYHVLHSSKLVRQLTTGLSSVNQAGRIVRAGCEHFHKLVRLKPRHNTRDLYDCQGKHETQTTIVSKVCL